jgi:RNA 3'-terminal phosphate cyclase (ATP)
MGPRIEAWLERPGFYPAGGGRIRIVVEPVPCLSPVSLLHRGRILARRAVARVSNLPRHIGERELAMVGALLDWSPKCLRYEEVRNATGPGNVLTLEIEAEGITELFTGFGRRGRPAERVASKVAEEVRRHLASGVPVGPYLADQLLVPFAVAGGGSFRTVRPTRHTLTAIEIVRMFLDVRVDVREESQGVWSLTMERLSGP